MSEPTWSPEDYQQAIAAAVSEATAAFDTAAAMQAELDSLIAVGDRPSPDEERPINLDDEGYGDASTT